MICTALDDMYYVDWFVSPWMVCTTENSLYCAELFALNVEQFIKYVKLFSLSLLICTMLSHSA